MRAVESVTLWYVRSRNVCLSCTTAHGRFVQAREGFNLRSSLLHRPVPAVCAAAVWWICVNACAALYLAVWTSNLPGAG